MLCNFDTLDKSINIVSDSA